MRLYRWLLRAYPAPFRRLYGADLEADFDDLLARTRPRGRGAVTRLWARTVVDTVRTGLGERLSRRGYRAGRSRVRIPRTGVADRVADAWQDLRIGARALGRSPGYAAAVIATLALGIGANTALFSVAYGTLLRPLPFASGDRLVRLVQEAPPATDPGAAPARAGFSVTDLEAYGAGVPGLVEMSEFHAMTFTLIDDGGPHRVRAGVVSANYFEFLGLEALHGRVLHPDEDHMGAEPVIVLTHGYWMERFGGDTAVVGTRVRMNDRVHEIVGVLPPRPQFPVAGDIFLPISACPTRSDPAFIADPSARMMWAYARLDDETDVAAAGQRADSLLSALAAADPAPYPVERGFDVRVVDLRDDMVADVRPLAAALLAVAAFVLLIACANAAGLALARAGRRLRELEVRGALGAGRGRLVRTLLGESLLLAAAGGVLGLGVALGGHDLLVGFAERFTTRAQEIRLDGAVLAFAATLSVVTGLVFGAVPGLWVGGRVRATGMESGAATVGARGRMLQRWLVVAQVAVAFAVVSAAGLALRTAWTVGSTELGFETTSVASLTISVDKERYRSPDSARVLFDRLAASIRQEPAVGKVARVVMGPLSGYMHRDAFFIGADADGGEPVTALSRVVDPGFFEILGMSVERGRAFTRADGPDAPPVAVVNHTFYERFMGGRFGVGATMVRCHGPDECLPPTTIVGVVADVRFDGPDEPVAPEVYEVARQNPVYGGENLVLEVRGDPAGLEQAVARRVQAVDPDLPVSDFASLEGLRQERTRPRRFLAWLLGGMAAVAAGLAVTGIFGVAALSAASRTRELGIRRALGATPANLTRRVVGEGLVVAVAGVGAGLILAWGFGRAFASFFTTILWGVAVHDRLTLGLTALLFTAVAVAAAWGPARRAAALDPMQVLKEP